MNFIDDNYITNATIGKPQCNSDSFVKDSTNHGWYEKEASTTCGSDDAYRVKNIYDLAGNVKEWTMESTNTSVRVNRGGDYGNSGQSDPASNRDNNRPNNTNSYIGFRIALYIN